LSEAARPRGTALLALGVTSIKPAFNEPHTELAGDRRRRPFAACASCQTLSRRKLIVVLQLRTPLDRPPSTRGYIAAANAWSIVRASSLTATTLLPKWETYKEICPMPTAQCKTCGTSITFNQDDAGRVRACPKCRSPVRMSGDPPAAAPAAVSLPPIPTLAENGPRFTCPYCGSHERPRFYSAMSVSGTIICLWILSVSLWLAVVLHPMFLVGALLFPVGVAFRTHHVRCIECSVPLSCNT
jgi:hypothetical protein